jgi:outer membrane protein assembly factor BamE (lipoprotein component of BamABCDE complex)|nr:outer membrane protein assembly factor BamE [Phyllobacterium trifolii]
MEMSLLQRIFKTGCSREYLLAGTFLLATGLAGCNTANLNPSETLTQGYVIDDKALEFVPVGSSREQVILSLGSPSTTATFDNEVFYYISQKAHRSVAFMQPKVTERRILAVYFDKDSKVSSVSNYGLQDGKVFDFISRTTPTGGKDLSFLGQLLQGVGKTPSMPSASGTPTGGAPDNP